MMPHISRRNLFVLGGGIAGGIALTACGSKGSSSSSPSALPTFASPTNTESVANAEQAGALVLYLASKAADAGSYGIAGAIVENKTGRVIHAIENQVLKRLPNGDVFTWDPTAHGERQLVYWYFANKAQLSLPEPHELTVVTSLDPCAMCTGTLLTAGFNVGVVAMDTFSGINYRENDEFADLPDNLAQQTQGSFGYYGVDGGRAYTGGTATAFRDSLLSVATFNGCEAIYQDSATSVRNARSSEDTPVDKLTDPSTLPAIVDAYRAVWPAAFNFRLASYRQPTAELKRVLEDLVSKTPGAKNAAAFVDPFGNVISASADTFEQSPVATAFMNIAQSYAQTRFALMSDSATSADALKSLVSPKWGTFVWLYGLDPDASTTIEDLGAYGSAVESKIPQPTPSNFQYFEPPRNGTEAELKAVAKNLPPLYSQLIEINPMRAVV